MSSAWVKSFRGPWGDVVIALALATLTLGVRLLTLENIETGGDPLDYWYFVRQWSHPNDITGWNHHYSRLGIHVPVFFVQKIFGEDIQNYYIAPLTAATLVSVLLYALGRQLGGRLLGVTAVLLLLIFTPFNRLSSQIRPEIFCSSYVLASALGLVRYATVSAEKRMPALVVASVFAFFSYLSKEPNLFFAPGMVVAIYLAHRRWKDCVLFAGILFVGFLAESTLHYFLHESTRLDVVQNRAVGPRTTSVWQIFDRVTTHLSAPWRAVFYPFFLLGPLYFWLDKSPARRVVVLLPASFLFLAVFGIRRLNPLRTMMPMNERYLSAAVPLCILTLLLLLAWGLRRVSSGRRTSDDTTVPAARRVPAFLSPLLAGISIVALLSFLGHKTWKASANNRHLHPLTQVQRAETTIDDAYGRHLPIIARFDKLIQEKYPRSRALHWASKGMISTEHLLVGGQLRRFSHERDTARLPGRGRYAYLPTSVSPRVARALDEAGCTVRLRTSRLKVRPLSGKLLPRRCDALRRDLLAEKAAVTDTVPAADPPEPAAPGAGGALPPTNEHP